MKKKIKEFILLLIIAFWFEGNTLFWSIDEVHQPWDYLRFQLDKTTFNAKEEIYPEINQDPILAIKTYPDKVLIFTKDKYWTLYYSGSFEDWYVTDYKIY